MKLTTIYINGRFLCRDATGVDRYAIELLKVLDSWVGRDDAKVSGIRFIVLIPRSSKLASWGPQHIRLRAVGFGSGQIWEQVTLPIASAGGLLVSFCNSAPVLKRLQVVAIHDAAPARVGSSFSRGFRLWYRFLMPLLGRLSRRIITVSQFSRRELSECYRIPASKIEIVGNGADHVPESSSDQCVSGVDLRQISSSLIRGRYVLCVGSTAPYKNLASAIRAAGLINPELGLKFVVAGGHNSRVFSAAESGGTEERTIFLGYVSDHLLLQLYRNAFCFVFPSLYEGFGIPPLEAMRCGCPVVASRAAAISEVLGNSPLYVDATNPQAIADAVERFSSEPELRAKHQSLGYDRASQFCWKRSAERLLSVLKDATRGSYEGSLAEGGS